MMNARATFHAADRMEPIDLHVDIIAESQPGLPIVDYQHASLATESPPLPTGLCLAGGGCSGAVFALLPERCAVMGIRVVSFDMPGHTPLGVLREATPPRALISRATSGSHVFTVSCNPILECTSA
jgi:hypothetical protein